MIKYCLENKLLADKTVIYVPYNLSEKYACKKARCIKRS